MNARSLRPVLVNLALAAAYLVVGYVTLSVGENGGVELRRLVWLGSGLALSVALLVPFPVWPGIVVAGSCITLAAGDPVPFALATGVANGLEIGLPVWILRRVGFDRALARVWDVWLLVFVAAGLGALLAALLSVAVLVTSGLAPASSFAPITLRWWATHGVGMLLLTPPILAVYSSEAPSRSYLVEFGAALAALAVTGGVSFLAPPDSLSARMFFLSFPFLVWCAVRLGVAGAAMGGSLVTVLALWGAESYRGPLVGETDSQTLILTWAFSNSVILTTLLAGALLASARRARRELLLGRRRLEVVLNTTQDAILVSDPEGRVVETNPAFRTLMGFQDPFLGEAVDQVLDRLLTRLSRDASFDPSALQAEPGDPPSRELLPLDDGSFYEVQMAPMQSDEFSGRIWSFHDISERLRAESERRRLERQLLHGQKLEGLGMLAGGVAHDFNNLLSIIIGHAEMLMEAGSEGQVRRDAEQIVETSQEAAALCRQLLSYAGEGSIMGGPVDLSESIADMHRLFQVSVSAHADLILDLPDEPVLVEGDRTQLRQVLMNLVTNASDSVAASRRQGTITLRTQTTRVESAWLSRALVDDGLKPGPYALVEVEDDGTGMDEETVSRIFDPFFSTKGPGRGLGLAATLGVVRSHRGALRVDTAPGEGSRFRLIFPLLSQEMGAGPSEAESAVARRSSDG